MSETKHSSRGASSSFTWLLCPGSPRVCEPIPNEDTEFSLEGTRAHAQAEAMLTDGKQPYPEMAKDVQPYVDLVWELVGFNDLLLVEQLVHFDEWVPGGFGTSDCIIIHDNGLLTVVDLKFGKGEQVFAEGNSQLRLYALGALQKYQYTHNITRVRYVVSQPRLDHYDEETLTVEELLVWAEYVRERAALTYDPKAELIPGEQQCRWCRAKHVCRARALHVLNVAGSEHLTPADVGLLLPHVELVRQWASDIDAHAYKLLKDATVVPGYKLVEGRSVRQLKEDAEAELLAAGLKKDQIYRSSYQTLGELEKLLGGKKKAAPVLEKITTKPPGQPTIVRNSDPRPALDMDTIAHFPTGD